MIVKIAATGRTAFAVPRTDISEEPAFQKNRHFRVGISETVHEFLQLFAKGRAGLPNPASGCTAEVAQPREPQELGKAEFFFERFEKPSPACHPEGIRQEVENETGKAFAALIQASIFRAFFD